MKCPACEQTMQNKGSVYQHSSFYDRMDLHCVNSQCPAQQEINYISHMSVLIYRWPYSFVNISESWTCYEYHLPFNVDGQWFHLIGQQEAFDGTILRTQEKPKPLMIVDFIPLSVNDDMYDNAWKLFKRLKNLLVYT